MRRLLLDTLPVPLISFLKEELVMLMRDDEMGFYPTNEGKDRRPRTSFASAR